MLTIFAFLLALPQAHANGIQYGSVATQLTQDPTVLTTALAAPNSPGIVTPLLQVTTTPAAGRILTSDAAGNATWQPNAGSGGGITQLTGNVTAGPGSGSVVATIANASVTGAKIAAATITNSNISTVDASKITTGTLPVARGGTGLTSAFASGRVMFSNGATSAADPLLVYDATNTRLSVGGSGTAAVNAIVASGSHTALQAFNSSAGNAFQATNVSAWTAALISRQNNATTGASLSMEFGRGTPASPTGALNGDEVGVIAGLPDASDGVAHGYSGAISFVTSEDALSTSTGGEIAISTTPNGGNLLPVERARVTNDGQLKAHYGVTLDTSTTQPTCNATHRGLLWVVQGAAGVTDVLQVCLKNSSDVYAWVTK